MKNKLRGEIWEQLGVLAPEEQRRVLDFARALVLSRPHGAAGKELLRFAGTIANDDLKKIRAAIEEGCEKVDVNGW